MKNEIIAVLLCIGLSFLVHFSGKADASSVVQNLSQEIDSTNFVAFEQGNMSFPSDWQVDQIGTDIWAYPPNPYEYENLTFGVILEALGLSKLDDFVDSDINSLKEYYENFQILESGRAELGNNESHKIVYKYGPQWSPTKVLTYYALHGNMAYRFIFSAPIDVYPNYIPIVNEIIDSINFDVKSNPYGRTQSGLAGMKLGSPPIDLVINPVTNKLYVAAHDTNRLFVLNGTSNVVISNITIGGIPNTLAINPVTNTIYAASHITDKVYVIDGSTDKLVQNISVGPNVWDIAVDANYFDPAGLIFVANRGIPNQGQNMISIIDGLTNKVEMNVTVGDSQPVGIGLNPLVNHAYVTGWNNTSYPIVSVIDYSVDTNRTILAKKVGDVSNYTGLFPAGIAVDPKTSAVYVANSGGNTVTVIDGNTSEIINDIPTGIFPNSLAINPITSKVYVSNTGEDTLSVIESSYASSSDSIQVDSPPYDVSINPETNLIYSANPKSKTISTIGGESDKPVATLRFHVTPFKSGSIICDGNEIAPETYVKVPLGKRCTSVDNKNFTFSSWSSLGGSNSTSQGFTVSSDGTYTANFSPVLTATSLFELISPYVSIIILVITLTVASIPSTFNKFKELLPLRGLEHVSHKDIDIIGTDSTVIAGLLVFLTLSNLQGGELIQLAIITVNVIFPFAASVISTLLNKKEYAIRLMSAGFIYLIISVIMIAVLLMP